MTEAIDWQLFVDLVPITRPAAGITTIHNKMKWTQLTHSKALRNTSRASAKCYNSKVVFVEVSCWAHVNKKQTMMSKELVKEIHRHLLSIFILTDPPMTFLSACGFSSTGAGGGALCASASVMLAAVKLHFHSEIPPSESSHNFLLLLLLSSPQTLSSFVTRLPPRGETCGL